MTERVLGDRQKALVESLRYFVERPARLKCAAGVEKLRLVSSNHPFADDGERPLWLWLELFEELGLDFESELRGLVREEFGAGAKVQKEQFSGYQGLTTFYHLLIPFA